MKEQITYDFFDKVDIRIGTVLSVKKNIAGVKSQFLVLGAIEEDGKVVLLHPSQPTNNGLKIA